MELGYMGVRYNETPLSVRELVSFTDSKKTELFETLQRIGVKQCMVLSTCNRSGIFFFYDGNKQWEQIDICYSGSFPDVDFAGYLQKKQGEEALMYLFRITAGLESLVLGEDQILGQVVEALEFAQLMGMAGKELNKVVRDAIRCSKRIKEELHISENPLSVSYVGVRRLAEVMGDRICGSRMLVIGSGKTAELALMYLREYVPEQIYICNRTRQRAGKLRERFPELRVVSYEDRYQILPQCEVVCICRGNFLKMKLHVLSFFCFLEFLKQIRIILCRIVCTYMVVDHIQDNLAGILCLLRPVGTG